MCPGKGAVVKLRNGPNQEAAGIETEAEGTKDKSQVCQGPQPLQRLPSPALSLCLCIHMWLSILRSPLWHYRLRRHFLTPFVSLPSSFKKSYSTYTWITQPCSPCVYTHVWVCTESRGHPLVTFLRSCPLHSVWKCFSLTWNLQKEARLAGELSWVSACFYLPKLGL